VRWHLKVMGAVSSRLVSRICGEIFRGQHEALDGLLRTHDPGHYHLLAHANIPHMSWECVHLDPSALGEGVPELVPPVKLGTDDVTALE
jgi:hypothetical protein